MFTLHIIDVIRAVLCGLIGAMLSSIVWSQTTEVRVTLLFLTILGIVIWLISFEQAD